MIFNAQGRPAQRTYADERIFRGALSGGASATWDAPPVLTRGAPECMCITSPCNCGAATRPALADLGIGPPPVIYEPGSMQQPVVFLPANPLEVQMQNRGGAAAPAGVDQVTAWLKNNQAMVWGTAGTLLVLALLMGRGRR